MTFGKAQKWLATIATCLSVVTVGVSGTVAFIKTATGSEEMKRDIAQIKRTIGFNSEKIGRMDERINIIYSIFRFPLNLNNNNQKDQGNNNETNNRYYAGGSNSDTNTVQ